MNAITRFTEYPVVQLPVGIGQIPELAQWQEVALDVFDARFYPALLLSHQLLFVRQIKRSAPLS